MCFSQSQLDLSCSSESVADEVPNYNKKVIKLSVNNKTNRKVDKSEEHNVSADKDT